MINRNKKKDMEQYKSATGVANLSETSKVHAPKYASMNSTYSSPDNKSHFVAGRISRIYARILPNVK